MSYSTEERKRRGRANIEVPCQYCGKVELRIREGVATCRSCSKGDRIRSKAKWVLVSCVTCGYAMPRRTTHPKAVCGKCQKVKRSVATVRKCCDCGGDTGGKTAGKRRCDDCNRKYRNAKAPKRDVCECGNQKLAKSRICFECSTKPKPKKFSFCAVCGVVFYRYKRKKRYKCCSKSCGAVYAKKLETKDCLECGHTFIGKGNRKRCLICRGDAHGTHGVDRERCDRYGVQWEAVSRAEVFKRDGFVCHLCGVKCDPYSNPMGRTYPTLDHVIPLSKGGPHTLSNVATAHRGCNASKGDKRPGASGL